MSNDSGNVVASIFGLVLLVIIAILWQLMWGVGGWGPKREAIGTVISKHVDIGSEKGVSHYMVTTDRAGTFEVDNGFMLGVWNADEIYGQLEVGKTYHLTSKGRRWANIFLQEYPYLVKVSVYHPGE